MQKKNQHYVPQFHLRRWSFDGKRVSLFNKKNSIYVDGKASIRDMAAKDYIYGKDGRLENYLGEIEARVSPIYSKIIADESFASLSKEDIVYLYLHITLCNERTLATAERFETFMKTLLKEVIEMKQAHGQDLDIDKNLIDEHIEIVNPCNMSIKSAFELFPAIMDLEMVLIKNSSENEFLTSDYPTIKYNLWANKRNLFSGWGLSSAGLMLILPISPRHAILLYDCAIYKIDNLVNDVLSIKRKGWIDEINKLMLLNANSNLFFSPNIPKKYLLNLRKTISKYEQNANGVGVFGNNESKLIGFMGKRILYQPTLKYIEIYPETLIFPVPGHAQGLLRPRSEAVVQEIEKERKNKKK